MSFIKRNLVALLSVLMLCTGLQATANASQSAVGSVCFDNSSTASYINLNNSNNAVGTGDFTLEMWAKLASGTPVSALVNGHSVYNGTNTLSIFTDGNPGGGNSSINTIGSITKPGSIPANTWVHVAYVRTAGSGVWYVNGVPKTWNGATEAPVTDNNDFTSANFRVGYPLTQTWPAGFTGCLAGVALTKSALYSANFSANLPYPSTREAPTNSVIFLKPTAGGFSNTGTGAAPVLTGSVTFNSDLPIAPLIAQTITFTSTAPASATYGSTYTPTATGGASGNSVTFTIDSTATSICAISAGVVTMTGVGTCKVNANQASSTTYSAAVQVQQSFSVTKAAQATLTASQVTSSATWNGSAFTATPSFSTIGGSDTGAVTYAVTNGTATGCSLSNAAASAVLTATTAGTCTITATKAATTNYNAATSTLAFTFSQLTTTSNLAISNSSFTYGSAVTLTATVSPSTATGTFSFSNNGTPISGCTAAPISAGAATCTTWKPAVGTYTPLTATYSGATNVLTSVSSNSISLQITRAPLTVTASSPTVFFGSAPPLITPSYSGFVNSETSAVVSGITCSTAYTTSSAVGSLPSTSCSGGSASNYQISYTNGAVNINQASSTISLALTAGATTATYGTSVVITATVNTPGVVTFKSGGTAITGCTSVTATTTATCTWTPSAFNTNTVLTADFLPTDSTNYSNLTAAGSLTINVGKAVLSITASSHSVAYGAAVPEITPTFSGFVNGEDSTVLSNLTCSTTYTTTTAVGTVGSSCSGAAAANYSFSYTAGVITITQGGQTSVLVITTTTVTYGSTLSLLTSGGNGGGANSFVVNSGPCSVLDSTLTSTAVGTCMVTATKAANGNYLAASSTSTAITVNTKGLTISGLTGVNKEFDRGITGTVTGSPTLVGVVGSDNVLLGGTPVFTFASANAANGITVTGSGYTLTGTTAGNYTLTQPTVTANITAKAARVAATNTTVAFGAPVTSGVTASGLISPDALGSASYTYTGTGTSTPPTAVGVYTVTPSNAVLSTGTIGNYTISYDIATVTILAKYTITYNANGGVIGSSSTTSTDFVVGDTALALPTPTREGFNFLGWFTLQSNGVQVTGAYTPSATATLWAHWIQKSLVGVGNSQKIGTITTLANVGNTYSATSTSGTVAVTYVANALPVGTVIDIYQMADSSRASSMISSADQYVLSLVIAWLTPTNTVPVLSSNDALTMVITDSAIKKGAKVYSLVGSDSTLLGTATVDGSVTVKILEDPEVYIAISKPDAPTGVSATTGGSRSSTVSWIVPATDGGSTIDLYTVTSNRGQTCTTVTTSCSVTGLSDATTYTFTVTARNSVGTSASSAPSAAILTEDTAGLALAAQQAADARVAAAAVVAQQTAAALAAQQAAAALAAQQAAAALAAQQIAVAPVAAAALVSTPVVMITPTLTSLTFVENATKDGGKLIWTGTDIESVLFTGVASTYPQPFNYAAFTITWTGELVNMVAGVTYTMKIEARSSTGGSASKTIEYTIAKPVVDTTAADAALKAAQEKAAAEKKAAEEAAAAALKIAQEKALAEAKAAAEVAALKVAEEKAAAEAKAAEDAAALKIAQEKAAAEKKAAEVAAALKVAQEMAAAEAKAAEEAAAIKAAEAKAAADAAALAIAKKTPVLNLFSSYSTAKYSAAQMAKMKKLTLKLEPATTLKCVGYINTKGTTMAKAKATALTQAKTTCASAKKLNPSIRTVVTTAALAKAPRPLVGASNTKAKYRVDLFSYKG